MPGSHLRGDTPEEIARFPTRPVPAPSLDDCGSDEERYEKCVEYARSMPGAFQVVLQPGDFCIYRNTLWHMGAYRPQDQRATIHDGALTQAFSDYMDATFAETAAGRAAGRVWAAYQNEEPPRVALEDRTTERWDGTGRPPHRASL